MVDTFTQNQIVRYVYSECSLTENQLIEECSAEDWSFREELVMLKEAKNFIPKALFSASPASLSKILDYSRL